jgi:hypothetical protein
VEKKGRLGMRFSPHEIWEDGGTALNSSEDRAGALLLGMFAAILSFWIIPETLKHFRSRSFN